MIQYIFSMNGAYALSRLADMTGDDWIQIYESISKDMQQPVSCLPQGALLGAAVFLLIWLCSRIFCRSRKTDWVRTGVISCCAVYVYVLVNIAFFSREPGSRTGVNMQLFGTWGDTPQARGYVIENIILFLPFGILFPCAFSLLRKVWCCVPIACLCSIALEGAQFTAQRGYCQLDDVVMNTTGAAVGWLLYRIILHRLMLFHENRRSGKT